MKHDVLTLLDRLSGPEWWMLALALAAHAGAVCLHTFAWCTVLAHEYGRTNVRWRTVLGGYAAGSAVNAFVPARAGVVLKLHLIKSRIPGATHAAVLSTLAVLVLFDALVTLVIVAWAIDVTLLPGPLELAHYQAFIGRAAIEQPLATAAAVGAAVAILVVLALVVRRQARRFARELRRGLGVVADPCFYFTRVLPVQALNWLVQLTALGLFLAAFDLPVTPRSVLVAQAAKSMALLIPFTPSGFGAQFALLMLAFSKRFPPSVVSAFALGMRAGVTLFNVGLGVAAMLLMLRTLRWRQALARVSHRPRRPQREDAPVIGRPTRVREQP